MASNGKRNGKQDSKQAAQDWNPPRGIRYFEDSTRPKPFFVQWREPATGHRKTMAFRTKGDREIKARALADARRMAPGDIPVFTTDRLRRFAEFERIVGSEVDPVFVAVEWKRTHQATGQMRLCDSAQRYVEAREAEGIGRDTLGHAKVDLQRIVDQFGSVRLADLEADAVRRWLADLPFADVTRRNHFKRLNALFNWAKRERLVLFNPCDNVIPPSWRTDEVSVASVEDIAKLFASTWERRPEVCGRLALEAFAGLRYSSAARLTPEDINWQDRGITLPGPKLKTRKRQYIDGLPDNLWRWLEAAPREAWEMTERQYMAAKSLAFAVAGVENPGNVLRHSFCSYHVALHKDAARTAVLLCHSSPRTLYQHYKGRATAADGERYFRITPETPPRSEDTPGQPSAPSPRSVNI